MGTPVPFRRVGNLHPKHVDERCKKTTQQQLRHLLQSKAFDTHQRTKLEQGTHKSRSQVWWGIGAITVTTLVICVSMCYLSGTGDLVVGLQPPSGSILQPSSADLTEHTSVSTHYWQQYTQPANDLICVHDNGAELVSSAMDVNKTPAQTPDDAATAESPGNDEHIAYTMGADLPASNVTISTADSQGADSPFSNMAANNDNNAAIVSGECTAAVDDHTPESSICLPESCKQILGSADLSADPSAEPTSALTASAQQAVTFESTSTASTTPDKAIREDAEQAVAAAIVEALGDSLLSEAHAQQTALLAPGRAEQVAALQAHVRAHLLSEPHFWQDFLKENKVLLAGAAVYMVVATMCTGAWCAYVTCQERQHNADWQCKLDKWAQGLEDKLHAANLDIPSSTSVEQQLHQGKLKQAGVKLQQHALGSSQQASSTLFDITAQSQSVPSADHPQPAEPNTADKPLVGVQSVQRSPQAQHGGVQPREPMWTCTQRLLFAVAASVLFIRGKLLVESVVLTGIRRRATKLLRWLVAAQTASDKLFATSCEDSSSAALV